MNNHKRVKSNRLIRPNAAAGSAAKAMLHNGNASPVGGDPELD